eukprot:TRINITY_DN50874_c0_g1_i1.p1 TRINITY_DN50874_c0_g1~~TRINITY_DN50874_c0_g1_i1.p1  ORF type:complete len:365 (+),score=65.55 TRINITY_DN50874_c0_g1_i1:29-1096(+)
MCSRACLALVLGSCYVMPLPHCWQTPRAVWAPQPLRRAPVLHRARTEASALREAYAKLGLEGCAASAEEVHEAFREIAREYYKQLSLEGQSDEDRGQAVAQFGAAKQAFEVITGQGRKAETRDPCTTAGPPEGGSMASRRSHHRVSSGVGHELWLDLRGQIDHSADARHIVMSLFFQVRSIVDKLGLSLYKEGKMCAVATEAASYDPKRLEWDFSWVPLVLVDADGSMRHASSESLLGQLKQQGLQELSEEEDQGLPTASAGVAAPPAKLSIFPSVVAEAEGKRATIDVDLQRPGEQQQVIAAAGTVHEVRLAEKKFGSKLRALLLPPDPSVWAVASSSVDPDTALNTAFSLRLW